MDNEPLNNWDLSPNKIKVRECYLWNTSLYLQRTWAAQSFKKNLALGTHTRTLLSKYSQVQRHRKNSSSPLIAAPQKQLTCPGHADPAVSGPEEPPEPLPLGSPKPLPRSSGGRPLFPGRERSTCGTKYRLEEPASRQGPPRPPGTRVLAPRRPFLDSGPGPRGAGREPRPRSTPRRRKPSEPLSCGGRRRADPVTGYLSSLLFFCFFPIVCQRRSQPQPLYSVSHRPTVPRPTLVSVQLRSPRAAASRTRLSTDPRTGTGHIWCELWVRKRIASPPRREDAGRGSSRAVLRVERLPLTGPSGGSPRAPFPQASSAHR